jgi:hypothetical protein
MYGVMEEKKLYWAKENEEGAIGVTASAGPAECIDGVAGGYPCDNVDLLSFTSLADLGSVGMLYYSNLLWNKEIKSFPFFFLSFFL